MIATDRVSFCLTLDQLANVHMLADPEERKVNDTTDCYFYLTSSGNNYLSVVRLPTHASKHCVGVAPCTLLVGSNKLVFGRTLADAEVDGALLDEDPTLFAAPYWVPLPPLPAASGLKAHHQTQTSLSASWTCRILKPSVKSSQHSTLIWRLSKKRWEPSTSTIWTFTRVPPHSQSCPSPRQLLPTISTSAGNGL